MFFHSDRNLSPSELDVHPQEIVIVSPRGRHLSKSLLNLFDYFVHDACLLMTYFVVINVPTNGTWGPIYHLVSHTQIVRIQLEPDILQSVRIQLIPEQC